jgi:hypothetical protein
MTDEERLAAQQAILAHYARKKSWNQGKRTSDIPATCMASRAEIVLHDQHGRRPKGVGKVIFDDVASAEAAARELGELYGCQFKAYQCHRSSHGHQHLSTINERKT